MKSNLVEVPAYYQGYVALVDHDDVLNGLRESMMDIFHFLKSIPEVKSEHRYAADKWTVKQVIGHMMDNERIMAYRALRFARNDQTELPGYEQNDYATEDNTQQRYLNELVEEFSCLRNSTIDLFSSFSPEMLKRKGTASGVEMSVETLGYIIVGHALHHSDVLKQYYLS